MGNHEDNILDMSSPPHEVGEKDPISRYDSSHEQPSQSGYDPSFTGCWYCFLGDETHHEPISTSHVRYDMSDIPAPDSAHCVESEVGPNTTPRGTPIPFHVERFGGTSHIAPSILVVEATSHVHPRPSVINPIRIPKPR